MEESDAAFWEDPGRHWFAGPTPAIQFRCRTRGPEAFYDPVTGELGSRYQVHMDQLRTLRDEVSFIVDRADTLHIRVLAELERLR